MTGFRVGVDIGGTFTDIVFLGADGKIHTKKISSSVEDYAQAIADGLDQVFGETGLQASAVEELRHGTTVASNAILESNGAFTGLITTKGFRDILEIRNLRMPRLYDLTWEKPVPLVERHLRVVVDERVNAQGGIDKPLDPKDAERAVDELLARKVEAIAVCLIHSYANPEHELMIKEIISRKAPGLPFCISFEVLPEIKEYERTSSTTINAYVMPIVASYLASLRENLDGAGVTVPLLLMQSNGGLTTADEAARLPMNIIESGPAAGVIGAQALARAGGLPNIVTFDMGGTTAKASLVENGEVTRSIEYQVGGGIMMGSRLLTGTGYMLKVPAIDLAEVGAGGGSIVWIDAGGSMQIGPQSAGADPGPVCYGAGGTEPTVTDANVLLGYINPNYLVGGELELDASKARAVFEDRIAKPFGPVGRARGVRRPPDRRLQHDPGDQVRVHRAGPRSEGVRAIRLRRLGSHLRCRNGPRTAHEADHGSAVARFVFLLRSPLRRRRAPLFTDLPAPPAQDRPRRAEPNLGPDR